MLTPKGSIIEQSGHKLQKHYTWSLADIRQLQCQGNTQPVAPAKRVTTPGGANQKTILEPMGHGATASDPSINANTRKGAYKA